MTKNKYKDTECTDIQISEVHSSELPMDRTVDFPWMFLSCI
uniref:Uncharacterized protein n=1 Tax=Arundo donax TaxID=35708 RepID=A0A0A8YTT3_ARUDO